jgi:hypothetical protein
MSATCCGRCGWGSSSVSGALARPIDAAYLGYLLEENARLRTERALLRDALEDVACNWACCDQCDTAAMLEDCVSIARDALEKP